LDAIAYCSERVQLNIGLSCFADGIALKIRLYLRVIRTAFNGGVPYPPTPPHPPYPPYPPYSPIPPNTPYPPGARFRRWLFLAIGVAADLIALVIPSCAALLWQARQRTISLAGWAVWARTFAFAMTAGIGFASTSHRRTALESSSHRRERREERTRWEARRETAMPANSPRRPWPASIGAGRKLMVLLKMLLLKLSVCVISHGKFGSRSQTRANLNSRFGGSTSLTQTGHSPRQAISPGGSCGAGRAGAPPWTSEVGRGGLASNSMRPHSARIRSTTPSCRGCRTLRRDAVPPK
jgi:hypothetical protein